MALVDLWQNARAQLAEKAFQQIIAFAGDGKLRDGGPAAEELRSFLGLVPTEFVSRYAAECLEKGFPESGLALQEVVNQIGRRLGFLVLDGRYRGQKGSIGFDGVWKNQGFSIVVEVKTTDAYRLDLDTIAEYRRRLAADGTISAEKSSMLIVVGRQDTGDLEAQIRGSRYAWDVRLISVEALERLMVLKEDLEDPNIIRRIHDILIPREFTKLDEIVDLVFSATEDVRESEMPVEEAGPTEKKITPSSFHAACIKRIERALRRDLLRQSRASFATAERDVAVLCAVSREYSTAHRDGYWFAFHPHQDEFLKKSPNGFVGLGCGSPDNILFVPYAEFSGWLEDFNRTELEARYYWHVRIHKKNERYLVAFKAGRESLDVTKYLLGSRVKVDNIEEGE